MKGHSTRAAEPAPSELEIRQQGLRILARLIARAYLREHQCDGASSVILSQNTPPGNSRR